MTARAQRFGSARSDPALAVLEGFHAVKHAVRFGAALTELVAGPGAPVAELAATLAPDVAAALAAAEPASDAEWSQLAPRLPRTGLLAIAVRPGAAAGWSTAAILGAGAPAPVVLLESPRTMGNLGACVRVAAAAGAAGVLATGTADPWHPDAVRGAAGLQFALPVDRTGLDAVLARGSRPLVALDPAGAALTPDALPDGAVLAFGTERGGLTPAVLGAADAVLALPMEPGVSSLNLATSVAAVLYAWRLAGGAAGVRATNTSSA